MFSDAWKAVAAAGWLCAVLAIGGALYLHGELRELERNGGATEQGLATCTDTNAGEQAIASDLEARLQACVGERASHLVELETLRLERVTLGHRQAAEFTQEREKREELYATDDECGALRRVPVCPRLAERLRAGPGGGAN
jgi:hypothetical protein